jgi:hypothetical protein
MNVWDYLGMAFNNRAVARYNVSKLDLAIEDWEMAVKIAPDNITFRKNLEKAKMARGW